MFNSNQEEYSQLPNDVSEAFNSYYHHSIPSNELEWKKLAYNQGNLVLASNIDFKNPIVKQAPNLKASKINTQNQLEENFIRNLNRNSFRLDSQRANLPTRESFMPKFVTVPKNRDPPVLFEIETVLSKDSMSSSDRDSAVSSLANFHPSTLNSVLCSNEDFKSMLESDDIACILSNTQPSGKFLNSDAFQPKTSNKDMIDIHSIPKRLLRETKIKSLKTAPSLMDILNNLNPGLEQQRETLPKAYIRHESLESKKHDVLSKISAFKEKRNSLVYSVKSKIYREPSLFKDKKNTKPNPISKDDVSFDELLFVLDKSHKSSIKGQKFGEITGTSGKIPCLISRSLPN